jgi:hypothetical protein
MMNKWKRMKWAKHVAPMGEMKNVYKILVGKSQGTRPLRKRRRRRKNTTDRDVRETAYENVNWIHLAHDWCQWRVLLNTIMKLVFHKSREVSLTSRVTSRSVFLDFMHRLVSNKPKTWGRKQSRFPKRRTSASIAICVFWVFYVYSVLFPF